MKKRALLVMGALLCLGLAAPASADVTVTNSGSANAFWSTYERVSRTSFRVTTWYVGVYSDASNAFSDVYKDVALCDDNEEKDCVSESSTYGSKELTAGEFAIDNLMLDTAHLDAVYDMQASDVEGNPIGDPVATHVVADWTGSGLIERDRGASVYSSGCTVFAGVFTGAYRPAEAKASVDGHSLGETYNAFLGAFLGTDVVQSC